MMLPISGRLTDRLGGGPVVVAGCCLVALATLPLVFVTDQTPYVLLGGVLFVRGLGLGASLQPTIAAAYALLDSSHVPRATAALNTIRQLGGSIGTALLSTLAASAASGFAAGRTPSTELVQQAAVHGYTTAFVWSAAIFAIGALVSWVLLSRGAPEPAEDATAELAFVH